MENLTVNELKEKCRSLNIKLTKSDGSSKLKADLIKSLSKVGGQIGGKRRSRKTSKRSSRKTSKRSSRKTSKRRSSRKASKRGSRKASKRLSRKTSKRSSRKTSKRGSKHCSKCDESVANCRCSKKSSKRRGSKRRSRKVSKKGSRRRSRKASKKKGRNNLVQSGGSIAAAAVPAVPTTQSPGSLIDVLSWNIGKLDKNYTSVVEHIKSRTNTFVIGLHESNLSNLQHALAEGQFTTTDSGTTEDTSDSVGDRTNDGNESDDGDESGSEDEGGDDDESESGDDGDEVDHDPINLSSSFTLQLWESGTHFLYLTKECYNKFTIILLVGGKKEDGKSPFTCTQKTNHKCIKGVKGWVGLHLTINGTTVFVTTAHLPFKDSIDSGTIKAHAKYVKYVQTNSGLIQNSDESTPCIVFGDLNSRTNIFPDNRHHKDAHYNLNFDTSWVKISNDSSVSLYEFMTGLTKLSQASSPVKWNILQNSKMTPINLRHFSNLNEQINYIYKTYLPFHSFDLLHSSPELFLQTYNTADKNNVFTSAINTETSLSYRMDDRKETGNKDHITTSSHNLNGPVSKAAWKFIIPANKSKSVRPDIKHDNLTKMKEWYLSEKTTDTDIPIQSFSCFSAKDKKLLKLRLPAYADVILYKNMDIFSNQQVVDSLYKTGAINDHLPITAQFNLNHQSPPSEDIQHQ